MPGQPITQGTGKRAAGTGYVNYINPNAFVLPPIKDGAGNLLSPFGNAAAILAALRRLTRPTWPSTRSFPRRSRA